MATHPSILSWRIPWTEEPGGLQSTGSQKPMYYWDFPGGSDGKESACKAGNLTSIPGLGWEDALEQEMATHPCILAWEIPWTEEPGRLQSMGPQRLGHN